MYDALLSVEKCVKGNTNNDESAPSRTSTQQRLRLNYYQRITDNQLEATLSDD